MGEFFPAKVRVCVGLAALACQGAILIVFARELHPLGQPYQSAIAGAGWFLAAAVLVFAAWTVSGPLYGVTSVALALTIAAATYQTGFDVAKALSLVVPVAAAIGYRARLMEGMSRQRGREENMSSEQVELMMATEAKRAKLATFERRAARIPRLRDACHALGASLEASQVYSTTVTEAAAVLDNAEHALLFLKQDYRLGLAAAHPALGPARLATCAPQEVDRFVLENGKPYLCTRTSGDVYRFTDDEPGPVASFAAAPIRIEGSAGPEPAGRQCLGVLRVTSSQEHAFSRTDQEALNIIATLAGMSLQNAALYEQCKQLAITDTLSGLYSRSYFRERFVEELTRSAREQAILSFLMMDIDNFKRFNDTYGHPAGDVVLQGIADTLRGHSQSGDILVRYGGEEFGALRQADHAAAKAWAEELRAGVVDARLGPAEGAEPLTISVGVSTFPADGLEVNELIEKADKAMYRAKQAGKNRVC